MIMPSIPISEPQMESESNMIAGLSPVTLPMILGVRNVSWIVCTMANTARAESRISQKLPPVSAAFKIVRHHVQETDKDAQTNRQWEVDDEETNGKQYAYAGGYHSLTTKIFIHTILNISY